MAYFLGRDIAVGISTEQPHYGIEFTNGDIAISGTVANEYNTSTEFIPKRTGVAEVSTITFASNVLADYETLATNNQYVLVYDSSGKKYLIWFDHDGTGEKPTNVVHDFNQEVDLSSTPAAKEDIRAATQNAIAADSDFAAAFTISGTGAVLTITDKDTGGATDIARGSGFDNNDLTVGTSTQGEGFDEDIGLKDNPELVLSDVTGLEMATSAMDEDIAFFGKRSALKAEIKKENTVTITRKKSDASFNQLFLQARCGIKGTTSMGEQGADSDNVAFNNTLFEMEHTGTNSGFGYRVYLQMKEGVEVLSLPNCCITEYAVALNADGVQEETITFYSNVTPLIKTTLEDNATTDI